MNVRVWVGENHACPEVQIQPIVLDFAMIVAVQQIISQITVLSFQGDNVASLYDSVIIPSDTEEDSEVFFDGTFPDIPAKETIHDAGEEVEVGIITLHH